MTTHTDKSKCSTAVVILNWNGEKLLREFLPQVVKHTPPHLADIIVADNASSDGSVAYIENNHPQIGVIRLDVNYGFAGGYNKAIAQLTHRYVVLLNSDAAPREEWIAPLIQLMEKNPTVAACVPKIKDYRRPTHFEYAGAAGGMIDSLGYPFCRGRIMESLEQDNGQYDTLIPVFWGSGAALMVRTEIYNRLGGLDEDFFAHMEEIDLCWRFKNSGLDIFQVPESSIYHLGGGTLNQQSSHKTYLNFRNNLFMLLKNDYSLLWFPRLLVRMILDGVAALHFLAKNEYGFFGAVFKAHIHFYSRIGYFYKKRSELKLKSSAKGHKEIFPHSIVWHYFIRKKRFFSSLEYYNQKR